MTDYPGNISEKERKTSGKIYKVAVDRNICIGAQSCVVVAPGTFQMDEQNLAFVVDPDSHDEETLLLGAQSCPVLAIKLYTKEGYLVFPQN